MSKNDHFQHMIETAHERGFEPEIVAFDSWYASLDNLKLVRQCEWHWLTQLKSNRQVSLDRTGNRPISQVLIPVQGRVVHLKGYGWVKVFKTVGTDGDDEYWATSKLDMTIEQAAFYALDAWQIEVYHRGLKQFTGIERAQYLSWPKIHIRSTNGPFVADNTAESFSLSKHPYWISRQK